MNMTNNPTCVHKWVSYMDSTGNRVKMVWACSYCKFEIREGFRLSPPKAPEASRIDSDDRPSIYSANLF